MKLPTQIPTLLLGTALTLVPTVPWEVRLVAGVALLLSGPGLLLAPLYGRHPPASFWTLVLITSLLVQFMSALTLLYIGTFTPANLFLLDLIFVAGLWLLSVHWPWAGRQP